MMKKSRLKKAISIILLFLMCMEIMSIQVYAAELELESKEFNSSNPYKFKFSYTWTSKGQTIQSYDVSENGQIAIVFSNHTIGVFDHDMNFLYQLSFKCNGASGVIWFEEKLLFIDLRSNTAVVCDNYGRSENFYEITGPRNYYHEVVQERMRNRGDYRYYCTNGSGGNSPLVHYGFYTILKRTSKEGEEEILYEVNTLFDGVFVARFFLLIYIAGLCWFGCYFVKKSKKIKNDK